MEKNEIRIGRVSSINKEKGTCRVVYKDKDDAVTMELPIFNMNGEYKMPEIDRLVLVIHLSNGAAAGIVMGEFWYDDKRPADPEAVFRKELAEIAGEAYLEYKNKQFLASANKIVLKTAINNVDIDDLVRRVESLESSMSSLGTEVSSLFVRG